MKPSSIRFLRAVVIAAVLAAALLAGRWGDWGDAGSGSTPVESAYSDRLSDVVLEVAGEVERVLADDLEGSRHQRFIVRLPSGHTVLVAHNIDLAERVPLARGDAVELRGEYEWNERGGVVHWTHHDPQGRRPGGWIRHQGREYR